MGSNTIVFPGLGWEFTIDPVAFSIGGLKIYWYGVLIALGMILAVVYCMYNAKRFGVDPDRLVDATLGGIVGGIIGARLYYVLFNITEFTDNPMKVFNIKEGGLAIYGGIIAGLLVGALICRWRKMSVRATFDIAVMGFLIGQAIGRWGNFVNQEAFGINTDLPWGMTGDGIVRTLSRQAGALRELGISVDVNAPVHPCFLYESLWCVIGFILLHFLSKKRKFEGQIFLGYIIWYGVGRFFIESLRTDSLMVMPGSSVRISQLIAAVTVIAAIVIYSVALRRMKLGSGTTVEYAGGLTGETLEQTAASEKEDESEWNEAQIEEDAAEQAGGDGEPSQEQAEKEMESGDDQDGKDH
ncbi:MAG: prolipoprotein diacylglyceryl transferase [Clostridiales bacterium]|nr:prolipoprotein diacylglyceryl transferase [Clostridiales bacterium]